MEAYNTGERLPRGRACTAADAAYREAYRNGDDSVLESALAFIKAWPGAKEGNPSAVSGIYYVKANAFKEVAKQSKPLKDPACHNASNAIFDAI